MESTITQFREDAVNQLKKHGIEGSYVYLIDLIPLIEMIWADGKVQDVETAILNDYLEAHVERINAISGYSFLTKEEARRFVSSFLGKRPDPELLKTLRSLIAPVRLSSSDETVNQILKDSLLSACIDIGAAAVVKYPFGPNERFNPSEKKCFFEILESFK